MTTHDLLYSEFLHCESDSERAELLEKVFAVEKNKQFSSKQEYSLWYTLSSLPTKTERARLAQNLQLPKWPDSRWCAATHLLTDLDQDVVANAINSFTFSKNRIIGHRLLPLFQLAERPQRVLYCLARYAEESCDNRFANKLSVFLSQDLSDAFLARSFNTLYRLGIKDNQAITVALELIETHVQATNMDRKAAVSAVLYLCFAGSKLHIERLNEIAQKVKIPELRRMLSWGLQTCAVYSKNNYSLEDAKKFLLNEASKIEPLFTGYGCFESEIVFEAVKSLGSELAFELGNRKNLNTSEKVKDTEVLLNLYKQLFDFTKTILALGDQESIEWLCRHEQLGLQNCFKNSNTHSLAELNAVLESICCLWLEYAPASSITFQKIVTNFELLSQTSILLTEKLSECFLIFCSSKLFSEKESQLFFEKCLTENSQKQVELQLIGCLLSIERAKLLAEDEINYQQFQECEEIFLRNLTLANKKFFNSQLASRIYSVLFGGNFSKTLVEKTIQTLGLNAQQWFFSALSITAPQIESSQATLLVQSEIKYLLNGIHAGSLAEETFTDRLISCYSAILWASEKFKFILDTETSNTLNNLAIQVQGIFDSIEENVQDSTHISELNSDDQEETEGADWKGKQFVDKPLLRWNSLVQILCSERVGISNSAHYGPQSVILNFSQLLLKESLRVAPHVDKRWVVKALAKIGSEDSQNSEDAIKALLYQALQHVDPEFVALTIRELLPLNHPRTQQTLVRCVGRTHVADDLKLLILDEIPLNNPQEILQELRTLELLRMPQHIDEAVRDAVGRVAALIDVEQQKVTSEQKTKYLSHDIDLIVKKQLPSWEKLGVDIRSALRTAEMILIQSKDWGQEAVDLSPIVNMHCKAVELTMRDLIEPHTDALLRKGVLSRKLDLLGYSRPIPEKMQVFEDYLGSLPVVKTIPYFSKFKLRKMLRAVCLFRPGKRFTLDGPKAFALLFLVTSRKKCTFGLENMFDVGFASDSDLFEFVKLIHSLQDSRNRAVHEGLTWEAQDEIDSLRKQAYRIIELCLNIDASIRSAMKSKKAS